MLAEVQYVQIQHCISYSWEDILQHWSNVIGITYLIIIVGREWGLNVVEGTSVLLKFESILEIKHIQVAYSEYRDLEQCYF